MKYIYFEFMDGSYCCSDHLDDPDAIALFERGMPLTFYDVREREESDSVTDSEAKIG